ncbi:MAG TPA: glycosyltransferase family 2 protein [Steroidobacteraceae bacterium]
MSVRLSLVVPCYNEAAVIDETAARLTAVMDQLHARDRIDSASEIYFVDDGSRDETWQRIELLAQRYPGVRGIKLSRNRGHQVALLAGLLTVPGDAVISLDADLQDDPNAIEAMLEAHAAGAQIVYGIRRSRRSDSAFKRFTAERCYALLAAIGVDIVFNHADFRLLGRRALDALSEFSEANLFLRGLVPQLGFPIASVYYDRAPRFAGETKYPTRRMLSLAWDGITSFSAVPLRMITTMGFIISIGSLAVATWAICVRLFTIEAVPGWASTVVPMYLLGGIQLLSLGIIGEYLAKTYLESKRRPRYFIEKTL